MGTDSIHAGDAEERSSSRGQAEGFRDGRWAPSATSDDEPTLGVVDFSICPHLAADGMPGNAIAEAEQLAAGMPNAAFEMNNQTAIMVSEGQVRAVSEGHWTQLRGLT